ncbi:MAG: zf-HC2 domain-containing protein [Dictyoglomaceae bacterium]|nr:zf-HC2 domain-containing protein [Dictyoglomaceae bacterium]
MRCREAKRLISLYIDGEISFEKRIELERHINNCFSCKKSLEDLRFIIKEVHNLPQLEPSINFADNLWYRYQEEKMTQKNFKRLFFILGLTFTLIFIFFLSQKIWTYKSEPQELQTLYELHSKWKKSFIFEDHFVDFVLYQNR